MMTKLAAYLSAAFGMKLVNKPSFNIVKQF